MVTRHIDIAIMAIRVTETAIIRTGTTDPIGPMAITTAAAHTTTGTATTATIGIITTIAIKLA